MKYEPFRPKGTKKFKVRLNIDDLNIPNKENIKDLVVFDVSTYPKLSKEDKEDIWYIMLGHINEFFASLTKDEQSAIAMVLIGFHHQILEFVTDDKIGKLDLFLNNMGQELVDLDDRIGLCDKLREFGRKNISIGDHSKAGKRPQDTASLTFVTEEVRDVLTIALVCKILSPVFGSIMAYTKQDIDTQLKEHHCAVLLTKLLDHRYHDLIIKLANYVGHTVSKAFKESTTSIFHGKTSASLKDKLYATTLVRHFVNVDLSSKNGNLMTYICVASKNTVTTQRSNDLSKRHDDRIPTQYSKDDEGSTPYLDNDLIVTDKTSDIPTIVESMVPKVLRTFKVEHEIGEEEYEGCLAFYMQNPILPRDLNVFLAGEMFKTYIGGAKGLHLLERPEFTQLMTLLQMIIFSLGYEDLGHLLSAGQKSTTPVNQSINDSLLKLNYRSSFEYKNCRAKYETVSQSSAKEWDEFMAGLITEITNTTYVYNTAPYLWDVHERKNINGSTMKVSGNIIAMMCSFLETMTV